MHISHPDSEPSFGAASCPEARLRTLTISHNEIRKMDASSSRTLKGLFNLVRTEFKDVRKEIRSLEDEVADVKGLVDERGRDEDEVLRCLRRIEDVLRTKTTPQPEASCVENHGVQEAKLLRLLLQASEDEDGFSTAQHGAQDSDRSASQSADAGVSIINEQASNGSKDHPANFVESLAGTAQNVPPESNSQAADLSEHTIVRQSQMENRLEILSDQIEDLKVGQKQILALLESLSKRDEKCVPVVVPPPRKVGRKVIGFVYEDEEDP